MSRTADKNRRIGIAGYMGAGKSACAARLSERLGLRVIDADAEAKMLMKNDKNIKRKLLRAFGPSIVKDGVLSFTSLSKRVFSSVREMRQLNAIVHPPLLDKIHTLLFSPGQSAILDAALIPLWDIEGWFGRCLWVEAPASLRSRRLRKKTGLTLVSHQTAHGAAAGNGAEAVGSRMENYQ